MPISDTIKQARERGANDDFIIKKILESNPGKKESFQEALNRGATATQILDEIVKQSAIKDRGKQEETIKKTKDKWKVGLAKAKQSSFLSDLLDVTRHPIVGIDISDHSIEVMQLSRSGKITAYGRAVLEPGIVEEGNIIEQKKLIDILTNVLKETKPFPLIADEINELKAIVSLPESKIYIQYFTFETKDNLFNNIREMIAKTIPLPIKDLYWDFLKIENKQGFRVICVAVKQDVIDSYIYFLRAAGITPVALDVESASVARGLIQEVYDPSKKKEKKEKETVKKAEDTMILDIGAKTTTITVYDAYGVMCFAVSVPYAGFLFTEKIAESLKLFREEAETLKVEQGFRPGTNVFPVLEKEAGKIVEEVKEAINFYKKEHSRDVQKILLAGGSALLPEIDGFFQKFFDIKVEIGNPLLKIKETEGLDRERGVLYSNVIGLSLRGISENPVKNGINLLPTEIKTKELKTQQGKRQSVLIASAVVALSGIALLSLSIFYLIYLPVPPPMQPLKYRMMNVFPLEGEEKTVRIKSEFSGQEINVFKTPGEESEVVFTVTDQDVLKLLQNIGVWYKIKLGDNEGWIQETYITIEGESVPQEEVVLEEEVVPQEETIPQENNNNIE
jgi:type IV pilus assembly protein PilM